MGNNHVKFKQIFKARTADRSLQNQIQQPF